MGTCKMIRKRVPKTEIVIDLDGPDGNANNLMGVAVSFARDMRMEDGEIKPIIKEMRSGDYKHLVTTFEKYFGSFVVLETTNEELLT